MSRREALAILTGGPIAATLAWTPAEAAQASARARQAPRPFAPAFFTPHEYATVRALVDLIIPRDERSGSATDAGVPEFMDFMMVDQPRRQTAMRGGLALIDVLSLERGDRRFLDASDGQRRALVDAIAYPTTGDPAVAHAVAFFSSFRDLTASGFWTTKMGIDDLQYQGNRFVAEWNGCPDAALKKLGLA